tara:strand:- start:655 stop:798 length:144 start_codon:yes stop_codon:yes gene_type:complete
MSLHQTWLGRVIDSFLLLFLEGLENHCHERAITLVSLFSEGFDSSSQ